MLQNVWLENTRKELKPAGRLDEINMLKICGRLNCKALNLHEV